MQYLHSTGYEPKASDARRFDTRFVLPFKQVIRRDDAIVCPHLQSKIQESLEGWWETTCRPALEDHDSRQPERKRCFLLAYSRHKGLSFAFRLIALER